MPSGKDFLPNDDTELVAWLANFLAVLNNNVSAVGLTAADLAPFASAQTAFSTAVTAQVAADAAFTNAVATKKARRVALEATLRPLIRRIANHPGMTDGLRGNLQITIPDRVLSRRGVGAEVPGVVLETKPGQVVIHFGTNPGNEQINGKPAWANGANIYRKKGGEATFVQIAFDTSSPYVDTVTGAAVNVSYRVAYRGVRDTDIGAYSAEQMVAAGG